MNAVAKLIGVIATSYAITCASAPREIVGRVVNVDGKPMGDVFVIATWLRNIPAFACGHLEVTRSDANGVFRIHEGDWGREISIVTYSPGFDEDLEEGKSLTDEQADAANRFHTLKAFTGSPNSRVKTLDRYDWFVECPDPHLYETLAPLYTAIDAEIERVDPSGTRYLPHSFMRHLTEVWEGRKREKARGVLK